MRALLQRVSYARVVADGRTVAEIGKGLLVFAAFERDDSRENAKRMFDRILAYRIFSDENGKMNLNVRQAGGRVLAVSQFTLAADTGRGNRPSFDPAMNPAEAEKLYDFFVDYGRSVHPELQTGVFGADMKVSLENDGPVTFMLEV